MILYLLYNKESKSVAISNKRVDIAGYINLLEIEPKIIIEATI